MPLADGTSAAEFRRRFARGPVVRTVRTVVVVEEALPSRLVLAGATVAAGSRVTLRHRMVVVEFCDADGVERTLVWEPRLADALACTGLHAPGGSRSPLSAPAQPRQVTTLERGLERCGVDASDVDFVALGDLRGHDLRRLAGSVRPLADEHQPRIGVFGRATLLVQARELETARDPHALLSPAYVRGAADDVLEERLTALDGDRELGGGVALLATPGLSAGHQSLALNTSEGVWVISGNGVASECWQPLLSKIPGVRRAAEADGREVVLAAGTASDPPALYDSLLLERALADASRADPRWLTILPDRELASYRRQWPAVPTFSHGGLTIGRR